MNLRQKLFVLLVAVALLPLALLASLEFRASSNLADRVAVANRDALVGDINRILTSTVDANAVDLDAEADVIGLALQVQAAAVEQRLAAAPPAVPLYFAAQFDGPRSNWPPHTAPERIGEVRIPVSYVSGAVQIPRGVDRAAVGDSLLRLAGTFPALRALSEQHPGLFFGQFTALDDGARNNYPGHGNFPPDYDSRQRSWYRAARAAGKMVWTPPLFSATTKQLTFIVAMPVHRPNGIFAGVAATEVAIVDLLHTIDRRTLRREITSSESIGHVASEAQLILVAPFATQRSGAADALRVLAERSYNRQAGDWTVAPALATIAGGGSPEYAAFVSDVAAGRSSVARLPYAGRDSLWAVSPVPVLGAALLLVLPYDRIVAAADARTQILRTAAGDQLRESLIVALVILALVAVVAYYVSGLATKQMRELAAVAERIGAGDLDARATVRGNDEVAAVATAFNAMVPRLQDGLRMQHGLELARAVQQNLLPLRPPVIPGFDISGTSVYCDETGGDYYDFVDLSQAADRRIAIAVGDVSGHGIGAALLMASVRAALRGSIDGHESPRISIERANRLLCADVNDGSFMTLALLEVDASAGTMRWVSAAHDAAALYRRGDDRFLPTEGSDIPIGVDADWPFTERELDLPPGEYVLALGTDGIWETEDAAAVQFGRERFRALVRESAALPADGICRIVMDDVAAYRGAAPVADDVTLVVIKFTVAEDE